MERVLLPVMHALVQCRRGKMCQSKSFLFTDFLLYFRHFGYEIENKPTQSDVECNFENVFS